ncbi:ABC transporter permease [Nocardioides sp. AN3]
MRMTLHRLGWGISTLFGASVLAFVLMRVLPGDPARLAAGDLATPEKVAETAKSMGLDQPLYVQYWKFVSGFFTGDWGFAYSVGSPARQEITSRLPASIELGLFAFVVGITAAVTFALLAVFTRRRWVDVAIRGVASVGLATPQFWLALVLLVIFSERLGWFPGPEGRLSPGVQAPDGPTHLYVVDGLLAGQPSVAWDALLHLILPGLVLAMVPAAFLLRLLRGNLMETSREQYMLVLRAKGTPRSKAFLKHAFPNAALPAITAGGLILAEMLAGSVLTEKAFGWPGVGSLVVDSILAKDFSVVQSFIFLSAIAYVVVNTFVDIAYGVIDPRIRSVAR